MLTSSSSLRRVRPSIVESCLQVTEKARDAGAFPPPVRVGEADTAMSYPPKLAISLIIAFFEIFAICNIMELVL
jgi:hypothetical protein